MGNYSRAVGLSHQTKRLFSTGINGPVCPVSAGRARLLGGLQESAVVSEYDEAEAVLHAELGVDRREVLLDRRGLYCQPGGDLFRRGQPLAEGGDNAPLGLGQAFDLGGVRIVG